MKNVINVCNNFEGCNRVQKKKCWNAKNENVLLRCRHTTNGSLQLPQQKETLIYWVDIHCGNTSHQFFLIRNNTNMLPVLRCVEYNFCNICIYVYTVLPITKKSLLFTSLAKSVFMVILMGIILRKIHLHQVFTLLRIVKSDINILNWENMPNTYICNNMQTENKYKKVYVCTLVKNSKIYHSSLVRINYFVLDN